MKINIESVEDEFFLLSKNVKYGKKHYDEFSKYIMKMNIEEINKNNILIKAQSALYSQENITSINIDKDGYVISSSCTCPYHSIMEPCGHVWMLAKYVKDHSLTCPYEYIGPHSENIVEFNKYIKEINDISEMLDDSSNWFDNLIKNQTYNLMTSSGHDNASIKPMLIFNELDGQKTYIKFLIGRDRDYVVKDIASKLINPYINNDILKFGKNLILRMNSDNLDIFSQKLVELLIKHKDDVINDKLFLRKNNIEDLFTIFEPSEYNIFEKMNMDFSMNFSKLGEFYELKAYMISDADNKSKIEINNKAFIISKNAVFYFDSKNENIKVIKVSETDADLLYRISENKLVFSSQDLFDFIDYISNKVESINIDNIFENIKENKEDLDIYCDLGDDDSVILNIKSNSYKINQIKSLNNILELLNISVQEKLMPYINGADKIKHIDETIEIKKVLDIDNFMEDALPALSKISSVYMSESMKNFNKTQKIRLSFGVKYRHDLLELDIDAENLDKDEIFDILSQYRKKKKYFKLKSGQRILIDRDELQALDNFISDLYIKDKEIKNSSIYLENYRLFQIKKLKSNQISMKIEDGIEDKLYNKIYNIDSKFNKILRSYQKEGVEWLLKLRSYSLNGILADDMGLGKSLQTIAYLASTEREKASIIVCPASLIFNWKNEFEKFNPDEKIICIHGSKEERDIQISKIEDEIVITSYDYLKRDIDVYEKLSFDTIIIDEAQYIKNHNTKASHSVKKIKADYKIALTGTPIENSLAELWSIFDFLMRGYLFKYDYFSKRYEKPIILDKNIELSDRLKTMVEPFILRRLKTEVLNELPEKIEDNIYIEMNAKEKELYRANVFQIRSQMASKEDNKNIKFEILAMLTRLRQICIEPRLLYSNISRKSSKIQACIELIDQCINSGKKIILFSTFTSVLDLIVEECNKKNINHLLLTGSTNKIDRKRYVDIFQDGDIPLFLISLKAGGTGLNLTEASVVIHIDPWWNISAQNQATDRAYRIGQKNKVQVYNLIAKDTIEEKILKMQSTKKEISDLFVENSSGSFHSMDDKDLLDLFDME